MQSPPPPPPPHAPRFAWAGRNFRIQTAATVISGLGNAGAPIATAFAILEGGGSTADVGYVTAARLLPTVLLLVLGGALADRLPRHHIMVAANLFSALAQAALAVLVLTGEAELWQLLLLSAGGGAGYAFYSPAAGGMILESVAPEHAARAFSVFRMGLNGAQIGGAALGGALTAAIGPGWVLAVDAGCFLVAAALRFFLETQPLTTARGGGMLRDLREGWQEFASRRWLWVIVLQFSVLVACVSAVEAVYGPIVAKQHLGGARAWGLAMAAYGIGLVSTGLLMVRWHPRRILLVGNWGVFLFGVPALALAVAAPLPVLAVAMFLSGAGVTVFGVNWMIALQQEIPAEAFSRVAAYDELGSLSLAPLGTALAGPAADALGLSGALWACAAISLVLSAAVLLEPQVRRLSRRTPAAPAAQSGGAAEPVAPADAHR
ncbi:MFS transporter [Kitasatospora sp. CM 4170]|uniref:MFS transporter n=1 Tax=Kitasatospora aburaviensis TaxID=67265 RepID=A0ABW1F0U8_9ACTN|nr:MFS transporter [Kitasatospora sp. CM 4170]WNM48913.1 MFS transporter [Kitasatospora sp. CM 4170]